MLYLNIGGSTGYVVVPLVTWLFHWLSGGSTFIKWNHGPWWNRPFTKINSVKNLKSQQKHAFTSYVFVFYHHHCTISGKILKYFLFVVLYLNIGGSTGYVVVPLVSWWFHRLRGGSTGFVVVPLVKWWFHWLCSGSTMVV